jgi:hypothetical protein
MATPPLTPERRAELRESFRQMREQNARSREDVLRQLEKLRRIRDAQRARQR